MRTPIRPREPEPTISAFKHFHSSNPEPPLLNTELHNIEVTTQPVVPDLKYPKVRGYEILSIVGYGGMGIVYEARHRELNRRVAIKTLRGDALAGREFRERFRAEAEAIARLQHPNIIQVFEVGTIEQQSSEVYANPFIALEFVDGGSLIQHTRAPQSPRFAAQIVETLARAAHAAHILGIVHRDLKPSNVLLTADGTPKIADFGIAKQIESSPATDSRQLTQTGSVMGTPEYMAPEQFDEAKASPAIDIYALGAILYQLLTGRVPFQGATFADTMLLTRTQDPVAPRRFQPEVPRDLEVICLKCLEKSPSRRYESAVALADDLARWAEGRTIRARPIGSVGRTVRWARRNPAVAVLSLTLLLVALTGMAGVAWKWQEAREKANEADLEASRALDAARKERWEHYRACILAASTQLRLEDGNAAKRSLDDAPEEYRDWVWNLLDSQLDKSQYVLRGRASPLIGRGISGNGRWLQLRGDDQSLHVLDTVTKQHYECVPCDVYAGSHTLSQDGSTLAYQNAAHEIVLVDVQTKRIRATLRGHTKPVHHLEFNRDGTKLFSVAGDATFRMWDTNSGQVIKSFEHDSLRDALIQLSPNKRVLAACPHSGRTVTLWDLETQKELALLSEHKEGLRFIRFSPKGDRVATVERFPNNVSHLWEVSSGKLLATFRGHQNQIQTVCFSPDGSRIASCSMDRTIRIWENPTAVASPDPRPLLVLKGHTGVVNSVAFSPDGKRLVSASFDATVRYWDTQSGDQVSVLRGHVNVVELVAFSADGMTIVSASADRTVRLWRTEEVERDRAIKGHESFVYSVAFHPDGERIASAAWDGTARIWNATTGRQLASFDHGKSTIVSSVAFHPDGRLLATVARDNYVRLWDIGSGQEVQRWKVPNIDWRDTRVDFSPKGDLLASGNPDGRIRIWDVNTGAEYATLGKHNDAIRAIAFSPDGRWLASVGEISDQTVRIWDVANKCEAQVLGKELGCVYSVAWNRASSLVASCSTDGTIRLWDTATWSQVGLLKTDTSVYDVTFTPDGKLLAAACSDNMIRLWDVRTKQEIAELSGHSSYVHSVAFSPDGSRLVSASGDRTIRVWDAHSPRQPGETLIR